ncbi:hypothetical protein J4G33_04260 [Actinotalea sp. BY-33]|uniref:Uncharacterized protein n=1 Tax=Actinotalea soli TaxID=2819234 RepID=A0A939LQA2_9CELL|nr:hypothetical protein [Actinotalea soli]MBO1751010.1 hypothetical protein [Actinotalea soli]
MVYKVLAAVPYAALTWVVFGLAVHRLLPSDSVDPWPVIHQAYAMALVFLPAAAFTAVERGARRTAVGGRWLIHALVLLTLVALFLGVLL